MVTNSTPATAVHHPPSPRLNRLRRHRRLYRLQQHMGRPQASETHMYVQSGLYRKDLQLTYLCNEI